MIELDVKQIRECLECMGIQIEKAKEAMDGIDNNLTEAYKAIDAVQFDYERMKYLTKKDE
jgi:hypothetical protein